MTASLALAACEPPEKLQLVKEDATDIPLRAAGDAFRDRFAEGDALFDFTYREADGLGPLFARNACSACHTAATKGPGAVQKMVVVEADGVTPRADQSALPYGHTVRPFKTAGATSGITIPKSVDGLKVTLRVGPAVFGRGYLEAIADAEIERVEREQATRADGIHGRINRVVFTSRANPGQPYHQHQEGEGNLIGRFGTKARIATVDDFSADAFQGDMGITSPMRPVELINPDGLVDDDRAGDDVNLDRVNAVSDYVRLLEIPRRTPPTSDRGEVLFAQVGCATCHVPSLRTRADYPIPALADRDAPVYSDLLLHDMGSLLADGLAEGTAGPQDWRTSPLIGVRHLTSFLHDGRAATLDEAVRAHQGPRSEANPVVQAFLALDEADRAALLDFVHSL